MTRLKSSSAAFHCSTTDGGMVHTDIDSLTGRYFILFRKDGNSSTVVHSKGFERLADANRTAETLVSQLTGEPDTERESDLEAFASQFIGKPVNEDCAGSLFWGAQF